jgi:AAA+ ATPase superfamily predicted ATPase
MPEFFELGPKTTRKGFFDFEEESAHFNKALREGARLVLIRGLRRTGKTSLLITGLEESSLPHLIIDARSITRGFTVSRQSLISAVGQAQDSFLRRNKAWVQDFLQAAKSLRGVVLREEGPIVRLAWGPSKEAADLTAFFGALGDVAEKRHTRMVIAFDEAQELKKLTDYDVRGMLANIYDHVRGLQIVLTGSQFGLLQDFVGLEQPTSALYGRSHELISTRRLEGPEAERFLQLGFAQAGVRVPREIVDEAVRRSGGIIGWLALFGHEICKSSTMDSALTRVNETASQVISSELNDFLQIRPGKAKARYQTLLSKVARSGPCGWTELKRALEEREGTRIADSILANLISNLVKASFFEVTKEKGYQIADPMIAEVMKGRT